jgi:cobalt-zinc-cadmium resistance protein CzcA
MGPISTGLGEIFMYTVEAQGGGHEATTARPYTPTDLREIQDWIIKPQLRNVPGVTEINTIGGYAKEIQVAPLPDKLVAYRPSPCRTWLPQSISQQPQRRCGLHRKARRAVSDPRAGTGLPCEDIGNIVVSSREGVPIRIHDVAEVGLGNELRTGAATENGREVVLGTVFMLIGENSRTVSQAVALRLDEINRTLPPGVVAQTVYDRTILVDKAIDTVRKNLIEGALLVIAILFLFLGNIRAAILTALVIPLAMLFTFTGMVTNRVSANLMSLGALDFGIIIDGAVVIVENCVRRLAHAQTHMQATAGRVLTRNERFHEVFAAAKEVRRPLLFGQLIIMVVYLPIFALTGVEGKMFHPMAFTVVAALVGAMILSVTFIPAAVALLDRRPGRRKGKPPDALGPTRLCPDAQGCMRNGPLVLTFALVAVGLGAIARHAHGQRVRAQPQRGRHRAARPAHPRHQPVAGHRDAGRAGARLVKQFPEVERFSPSSARPRSPPTRCRPTSPTTS